MRSHRPAGRIALCALLTSMTTSILAAAPDAAFDTELQTIAQEWDRANFESASKAVRRTALEALGRRAAAFVQQYPDRAEPLVWEGIVLSSYADAKGGLGALGLAKRSRDRLLEALQIDPLALAGSAYTSLGVLYYKVPGRPFGFGNQEQAREYLRKALEINPDGIDPNYFLGELIFEQGDFAQALSYLKKAEAAPPRENRPIADRARRREIADLMQRVQNELG